MPATSRHQIHQLHRVSRVTASAFVALLAITVSACGASSGAAKPTSTPGATTKPLIYFTAVLTPGIGTPAPTQTDETLYAIDAASGLQAWSATLQGQTQEVPVLVSNILFANTIEVTRSTSGDPTAASITGRLYAFDAQTGRLLRQKDTTNEGYAELYSADDLLIAIHFTFALDATPTSQSALVALKPSDGSQVWQSALSGANAEYRVAVAQNRIFVTAETGGAQASGPVTTISAFDAAHGSTLWSHQEPQMAGALIATNAVVYITTSDTSGATGLLALDAATGAQLWQKPSTVSQSALAAANQKLAFVTVPFQQPSKTTIIPGNVIALNSSDGSQAWQAPYEVTNATNTLVATESVIYGAATPMRIGASPVNNSVFALNALTGAQLWSVSLGENALPTAIAVGADAIFVLEGDQAGTALVAYSAANGSHLWSFALPSFAVLGPIIG